MACDSRRGPNTMQCIILWVSMGWEGALSLSRYPGKERTSLGLSKPLPMQAITSSPQRCTPSAPRAARLVSRALRSAYASSDLASHLQQTRVAVDENVLENLTTGSGRQCDKT